MDAGFIISGILRIYDLGMFPRVCCNKISIKMKKMDFVLLFDLFCLKWGANHGPVSTRVLASPLLHHPCRGVGAGTLTRGDEGMREDRHMDTEKLG